MKMKTIQFNIFKVVNLFNKRHICYFFIIYLFSLKYLIKKNQNVELYENNFNSLESKNQNRLINFEKFNNETGSSEYLVPNIVHYICLEKNKIDFGHFLSILSVYLNHNPLYIYIHCNECNFSHSKYWKMLNKIGKLKSKLKIKRLIKFSNKIFGVEPEWIHHKSDVLRNLVLMSYGGIYLDNDVLVINSLNKYRKFEIVSSWDSDKDGVGSQVLIANRNARFLRATFDLFRY